MKTTIEIPDSLLNEARRAAAKRGTTLRSLVEEGLRRVLGEGPEPQVSRLRKVTFGGAGGGTLRRVDDAGHEWEEAEVEATIKDIVAALTPGGTSGALKRATRFQADLGWDKWYKLKVVKPVRRRLHETLEDNVVLYEVKTVGDLVKYVWSRMGEPGPVP